MPLLLDRRKFLLAAAAAPFLRAQPTEARVALLSDTHIAADPSDHYRGFYPHQNLRKVLDQVQAAHYDLLLINGDLARKTGQEADYRALGTFFDPLARQMALALTLGNHDDRKVARAAMIHRTGDAQPLEQKLVTTLDIGPLLFVMLDSLLATDIAPGQLGHLQRQWLRTYLQANRSKPVIVFVHHNPDPEGDTALVDAAELLRVVEADRNVKGLFFGHTHVSSHTVVDGLHLVNLPAVGYNFADGNPVGWIIGRFTAHSATLQLIAVAGEMSNSGKELELAWRA